MATYVALLYSVVLTPQRRVVMADLRQMAGQLGLKQVRTLAATGNLVFEAPETATAELEGRLEAAFEEKFGRHVDIVVRTSEAWSRLAACNPFPDEASATPDQVAVRVMRHPVPADAEGPLGEAVAADDVVELVAALVIGPAADPVSLVSSRDAGISRASELPTSTRRADVEVALGRGLGVWVSCGIPSRVSRTSAQPKSTGIPRPATPRRPGRRYSPPCAVICGGPSGSSSCSRGPLSH